MRIDKFLSQMKFCTRKQVKSFLKEHKVVIKQERIISQNYSFDPDNDKIYIDDKYVYYEHPIHLMMHKPKGYISANKDELYPCVIDLIKEPYDRFDFSIAGRLDVDTEGLLILTTDGKLIHEITHPNQHLPKVYEAVLDKVFLHEKDLLEGVIVNDGNQKPYQAIALKVEKNDYKVWITIDEGKFHQVKRMFLSVGYKVLYLKRIQIGKLKLNDLPIGEVRQIKRSELFD